MEVVGLGIGVAGLAGLFTTCIDCFELIQQGRYLGKDYLLLETKFSNQRLRFMTWGRACGLIDSEGYDSALDEEELRTCIEATLNHLIQLFKDGKDLRKKYGLKQEQSGQSLNLTRTAFNTTNWTQKFQDFKSSVAKTQKQASLTKSARWAIEDRKKFTELVQHLKDLIDDLEGLTRYLSVAERQRELIECEVESISDIPTLENIEEARLGRIDAISDAASLRLWRLRDQYLPTERTELPVSNTLQTISRHSSDDGWENLSDGAANINISNDSQVQYQILHRVHCGEGTTPRIFLNLPTVQTGQDDETRWTSLSTTYLTREEEHDHLCGRRAIASLDAYLKQNSALPFIVFQNYYCCNEANIKHNPNQQSIYLVSERLCGNLQYISRFSPSAPEFKPKTEIRAPYIWFYHEIYLRKDSPGIIEALKKEYMQLLFDFIGDQMVHEWKIVSSMLFGRRATISWKYLNYAYRPGTVLFVRGGSNGQKYDRSFEQSEELPDGFFQQSSVEIKGYWWEFDGNFERTRTCHTLDKSDFNNSEDNEIKMTKLMVFPLIYADGKGALKKDLTLRGEVFWKCRVRLYVHYTSYTPEGDDEFIDGVRFMVDENTYKKLHNNPSQRRLRDELGVEKMASDKPPAIPNFLMLLAPTIRGFNMERKVWASLEVFGIHLVGWTEKTTIEFPVAMPMDTRELVIALVDKKARKATIEELQIRDLVKGKEKGLILLFHGGPGTGKTLAAEKIAEYIRKPLYRITFGDMGANAEELDKMLTTVMYFGKTWDCVILLDDADIILEQRGNNGLDQNAMMAVLMRHLDSLSGTLILTSNRVASFDGSLRSRINLAIQFQNLNQHQRGTIWRAMLQNTAVGLQDVEHLSELDMDGRQIYSTISSALQLAEHKEVPLDYKILQTVMRISGKFERYLMNVSGPTEVEYPARSPEQRLAAWFAKNDDQDTEEKPTTFRLSDDTDQEERNTIITGDDHEQLRPTSPKPPSTKSDDSLLPREHFQWPNGKGPSTPAPKEGLYSTLIANDNDKQLQPKSPKPSSIKSLESLLPKEYHPGLRDRKVSSYTPAPKGGLYSTPTVSSTYLRDGDFI